MWANLFRGRVFKFLVGGGLAAIFNLLLIYLMIDRLGFNSPVLRNGANIVAIELSLLFSFFIYRIWVWPGGVWTLRSVLFKQLPLYNLSAGASVFARIFLIFPVLDWLKVNYAVNTFIGVAVSASINYLISDKLVFKTPNKGLNSQRSELYYPEGLEPGLGDRSDLQIPHYHHIVGSPSPTRKIKLLSVVIPAHNEEGSIAETIQSICQLLEDNNIYYEILVINDNSRDRTEEILQQLNAENQRIRYINNYYPNGFGFAVRCGLENFQGDAVAIMMADNSDDPQDLVDYYYKLQEGYECVFGSRFIKGGKVIEYPIHKLMINRLANLFIQILFGLKFNDTTNAFKAYRREVIEGVSPLLSHHFNLTVEIPLKAIVRGYSYTTIPITWRNRKTGISKLKIKEMGNRYLFIVLYIFLEKWLSRGDYVRKQNHPLVNSTSQTKPIINVNYD